MVSIVIMVRRANSVIINTNMKTTIASCTVTFFLLAQLAMLSNAQAAGLIVNEASNGTSGSREFFELLVVGDVANPTTPIDIDRWIIDDNNGDWEGSMPGVGIAFGHLRFDRQTDPASCAALETMSPGSLLVVYHNNGGSPNISLPPDDIDDSNNDGVYIFSAVGPCIRSCNTTPPNTSDASYNTCAVAGPPSASLIALRNGGDVAQTRRPDATFVHGFAYGDVSVPYPTNSFNVATGSGTGRNFYFSCGDWFDGDNFDFRAAAGTPGDTPGLANDASNQILRDRIQFGGFDYTNLAAAANCADPTVADVSVTKSLDTPGPYAQGSPVTYTIVVSNAGPETATDILLEDTPANLTIDSISGACSAFPCTIASLAAGANATITVTGSPTLDGNFDNSVAVSGDFLDPNPGNTTAEVLGTLAATTRQIPTINAYGLCLLALLMLGAGFRARRKQPTSG